MIDFWKSLIIPELGWLLQMLIFSCRALEKIPLFFIMELRTGMWGVKTFPKRGLEQIYLFGLPYLGKIVNKWRLYKLFRSRDMGRAVAVRRWTPTALECYKRGCNCEGCFYRDFFSGSSQKCQMKASVLELVRVIGTPNVELQQFIIED